jgi:peptide/nickel transport system ATP-binding protein
MNATPLLDVRGLDKTYRIRRGLRATELRALADVSFRLDRGEVAALVGESGSGKSTVARVLVRLVEPSGGAVLLDGADVRAAEPRGASLAYRRRVQMIFQDPYASLNPAHTVAHHLERPLARHRPGDDRAARTAQVHRLLVDVGLSPPAELARRRPHELSGGQRQRVAIARALAVEPDLLVADEPTSMLDLSLRVEVLDLLARLRQERRLALLLITHDLASARYLADRILVLYAGRIVEEAPAEALLQRPTHPYTRLLLAASPSPQRRLAGAPPPRRRPGGPPAQTGCPYAERCAWVTARCRAEAPPPIVVAAGHRVRCHRAGEEVP